MNDTLSQQLNNLKRKRKEKSRVTAVLIILSLIVVIAVTWQLRLTGKTLVGDAYCGIEEHVHSEECVEKRLICDVEHEHTDECYEIIYTCGLSEHIHSVECYSDLKADIETASDWKSTFSDVELNESWQQNIAAIAASQIGYKESERNFILDDASAKKGYTRYGEWFGNKYGDWSVMFVSFCAHYANIPDEAMPKSSGAAAMAKMFDENGFLQRNNDYVPKLGDIIFFDLNKDGRPESAGIISCVDYVRSQYSVIEGDYNDAVAENNYDFSQIHSDGVYGAANISAVKTAYESRPFTYAVGDDTEVIHIRPMMQNLVKGGDNVVAPVQGEYEQIYIDKPSHIRATVADDGTALIEVQITDEYENFDFEKAILHKHGTQNLSTDSDARNPGVNCNCEDAIQLDNLRTEITEEGLHVVVATFEQRIIDSLEEWSIVAYYTAEDVKYTRYPATFFDYDYSGGANGGSGINNSNNFEFPNGANRLGIGLKDYYHTGGHDQMGNHPWNAMIPITDDNGNATGVTLDANANNGQSDTSNLRDYPIIQGMINGLSGSRYSNVDWMNGLDQPGLFSAVPKTGKTLYSDYDLEFYNIGNTYVLNGAFNNTTQKYSTEGVFNKDNKGNFSEGSNFWPLDDQEAGQKFNHIYDTNISNVYHNWYFGMRYDVSFSLTEDYVGDLYFTFSGDDDMWVFLDGQPILDLGGMHSAYPTRYDVDVSRDDINKLHTTDGQYSTAYSWGNQVDLWQYVQENDTSEHIITVLYMERGGYDSNCYMEFTLPNVKMVSRVITPNAELDISKTDENGSALANAEFTLYFDKEGTKPAPYYKNSNLTGIVENGKMTTDQNGKIHVYGISDGEYYLYETRPPTGYEMIDGPVLSFIVEDGIVKQCESSVPNVTHSVAGVQISLGVKNNKAGEASINVRVLKKWDDGLAHNDNTVTVRLYRDGVPIPGDAYTVTLGSSNNWTYTWNSLPKSSAATGQIYKYTVVESELDGYIPEYSAQWVYGVNAWVKTDEIVNGRDYILTNGSNYAMYTNTSGATVFNGNVYPANNTSGNFPVRINGDILTADSIPDNILWTAQANGNYFRFVNKWSVAAQGVTPKYLRIEGNGKTFKTANEAYKSNFVFRNENGKMVFRGYNEGTTAGTLYRVRFEANKFASGESNAGSDIVPFVLQNTPDTYEITVINKASYDYELPATGGGGTIIYTFGGIILMAIPLLYGLNFMRKRERRYKS